MKKRLIVIVFFVVVFGLPVAWYLFLQIFGENKFALPEIGKWNQECLVVNIPTLVIGEEATAHPNEMNRIMAKLSEQNLIEIVSLVSAADSCLEGYPIVFVDQKGIVRGQFQWTREELDRMMAEVDVFLLNNASNDLK